MRKIIVSNLMSLDGFFERPNHELDWCVVDEGYRRPQGFSVSLQIKEPADAERIFHALEESGQVTMPIQQTFWATRFGMVVDRFGIPWMINCDGAA